MNKTTVRVARGVVGYFLDISYLKMPKKSYYAVRTGRTTGVYNSWSECEAQVKKYPGAVFKGFQDYSSADSFVNESGGPGYGGRSHVSNARERYSGNFIGDSRKSNSSGSRSNCGRDLPQPSSSSKEWSQPQEWSQPPSSKQASSSREWSSSSSSMAKSKKACPTVYSDGCCKNNGFSGAEAGVGVYWGQGSSHNISEKLQGQPTNQRAEVVAACRAIESAIEQGHSAVQICTDSKYTINSATKWIHSWKKNGWQTSLHHDVKNKSDMERLDNLCRKVDVTWTHVRGHVGIPGNEAADALAKAGSNRGH